MSDNPKVKGRQLTEDEILAIAQVKAKDVRIAQNKSVGVVKEFLGAN